MKINRRERIALGIFSTALVSLAVDKLLLPAAEPKEAHGMDAPARVKSATDPGTLLRPFPAPTSAPAEISDIFAWTRLGVVAPSAAAPIESDVAFGTNHKIEGVVLGPRPAAIISGRIVRVGDELDGFRLEAVTADGATFVADQRRVVLAVERPKTRR